MRCRNCGAEHEEIQSIKEGEEYLKNARCQIVYSKPIQKTTADNVSDPAEELVSCGGSFERLIGGTQFTLGPGSWFRNGYSQWLP